MTTASGTLTPAELLAQDADMLAYYYQGLFPMDDPNAGITDDYYFNTMVNDPIYQIQLITLRLDLVSNYSGFSGLTESQISDLINDAIGIIIGGINGSGPGSGEDYEAWSQRKKYRDCIAAANEWLSQNSGTPDGSTPPSAPTDELVADWENMMDACCTS